MRTKFIFLISGLIIFLTAFSISADSKKFVQFTSREINTSESAQKLSTKLKSLDGVEMCRVDHLTNSVYLIFKPGTSYSKDYFAELLKENGFNMACFYEGIQGQDKFQQLGTKDCN